MKDNIDTLFRSYITDYGKNKEPISVNFRELTPEINIRERYTHLIHSYPAKLLVNIPYFFLKTDFFCPKGGIVLDPFCGTGTVALESILSGKNCYVADANPLALLITQAKTTYLEQEKILATLNTVITRAKKIEVIDETSADIVGFWFSASTIKQLKQLEVSISLIKNQSEKVFFQVCFSNLIKKVSFSDPSISVPVKINPKRFSSSPERMREAEFRLATLQNIEVFEKFDSICHLNINRIERLRDVNQSVTLVSSDARRLTTDLHSDRLLDNESIDLVLTSPPYAGAQKYIRSSWLNLYWLGIKDPTEIRKLNDLNIGRESYHRNDLTLVKTGISEADDIISELYNEGNEERSFIVGNYLLEMEKAIDESVRVLKKGGYFIVVIGNNTVCGRPFDTQSYLSEYMSSKGLDIQFKLIDDIKSYGLMTKRNKTASRISREWVLVFKKI